jgi:hypothetical protein
MDVLESFEYEKSRLSLRKYTVNTEQNIPFAGSFAVFSWVAKPNCVVGHISVNEKKKFSDRDLDLPKGFR